MFAAGRSIEEGDSSPGEGGSAPLPALVLGPGMTALGALRTLASAGIPTYVACAPDDVPARSRWFRSASVAPWDGTPGSADPSALERLSLPGAVLFPGCDDASVFVSTLPAPVRSRFPCSVPPPDALLRLVDKKLFANTLAQTDVPHPWTRLVSTESDLDVLGDGSHGRLFLKPTRSQEFSRAHGVKAFHPAGMEDAVKLWRSERDAGRELLLQEYIPGAPMNHVFIDGFRDSCGIVRALFARRRIRMYPPDFGCSSALVSIPLDEVRRAADGLVRLVEAIAYRGIFSAEFKRDDRDGEYKILEVNSRLWWYVEYAARCGVDVCRMAYLDALGMPVRSVDAYRVGRRMVYPYLDVAARSVTPRSERPNLFEWLAFWIGAYQPVFRWNDPVPALTRARELVELFLARRTRHTT